MRSIKSHPSPTDAMFVVTRGAAGSSTTKRARRVVLVGVILTTLTILPATQARAATGTPLPFNALYRLVVDGAHDQEFVSGGPGTDKLAVMDGAGSIATTISMQGPTGMILVGPDLFVAEAAAPDIAVVDTSTDLVSRTIDIASFTQPRDLTYVGGRLWFFTDQGLVSVLPDGTDLEGPFAVGPFYSEPMFFDGLDHESGLMIFESGGSSVGRYTATIPPRAIDSFSSPGEAGNIGQITVLPGDASFAIAAGAPYGFPDVRLTDGETLRTYSAAPYPTAVATTSEAGGLVAGGTSSSFPDVWAYRMGDPADFFEADVGSGYEGVAPRGLAWSDTADRLFVVTRTGSYFDTDPVFYVVTPTGMPSVQSSTLSIQTSVDPVPVGSSVDVTVHLDGGATNHDVKVWAQPLDGTRALIASATVDGGGDLTIPNYSLTRTTTFTAGFAGDVSWGAATTAHTVEVESATREQVIGSDRKVGRYAVFKRRQLVSLEANVVPTIGSCSGRLVLQYDAGDGWQTKRVTGFTYSNGSLSTGYSLLRSNPRYRVHVESDACRSYLSSTSAWRYFRFT